MAAKPQADVPLRYRKPEVRFSDLDAVKKLSDAQRRFAVNSYKKLASSGGNVFFSPASISTALTMVLLGAREKSLEEMSSTLCVSELGDNVHESVRDFFDTITSSDHDVSGYTLKAANRLFTAQGQHIVDAFTTECNKFYHAEASPMDFKGDASGCQKSINKWVEDQTNEKIKDLIPDGMIGDTTIMILVNAIYFKGDWLYPFKRETTKTVPFYTTPEVIYAAI